HLATAQDGVVDWNDTAGRIVSGVLQEGKHQQLLDHSANVSRGQLEAAKKGSWLGSPPYGYRIEGKKKDKSSWTTRARSASSSAPSASSSTRAGRWATSPTA